MCGEAFNLNLKVCEFNRRIPTISDYLSLGRKFLNIPSPLLNFVR